MRGLLEWAKYDSLVASKASEVMEIIPKSVEPNSNSAAKTYQKAIFDQGIPITAFSVTDIQKEYARLKKLGVEFTMEPTNMGMMIAAVFNDTCGNLIQIYQMTA